jgi:ATP-dependent DNA helicase RecG
MTETELHELIAQGESETLEFKRSTGQRTDAAKTVCAMLNGRGGRVLIGVTNDGRVHGQQVADTTRLALARELSRIEPLPVTDVETVTTQDLRAVLAVHVPGRTGLYTFDGRAYIRHGPTTVPMPAYQYEMRVAEKLHATLRWESQVADDLTIADLDAEEIIRTVQNGQRLGRIPADFDPDPGAVLRAFRLLEGDRLLNGAAALYGRTDRLGARHMQLGIRLARFRGTSYTADFDDNRQYFGNVFQLLRHGERFLMDHVHIASRLVAGRMIREDQPAYPPLATREALANALCHRNYATAGETVGIAFFDDRLEIISPGGLHFGLTLDDLAKPHASQPWNPSMANALFRAGVIEQWGTGTTRIGQWCLKNGNPAPAWEERTGSLVIVFRPAGGVAEQVGAQEAQVGAQEAQVGAQEAQVGAQEAQVGATAVERAVLQACATGPRSGRELLAAAGYGTRTGHFKRGLAKLLEARLIEMTIPDKPNSRLQKYRLTAKGKAALAEGRQP